MVSSHPTTDLTVPKVQKAALVEAADKPVRIIEKAVVQESELKPGEVLVKILYSGRVFCLQTQYNLFLPLVLC